MPQPRALPGTYIAEVPSASVRDIAGVATSVTAFLGRAPRGPLDEPVLCGGPGDVLREFGLPHADFPMGESVSDFFTNGGSQALVVRLDGGTDEGKALPAYIDLPGAGFRLAAASAGRWGNALRARIERPFEGLSDGPAREAAERLEVGIADLFDLIVFDPENGRLESFRNLTARDSPRAIGPVLEAESRLVRHAGGAAAAPASSGAAGADGDIWSKAADNNASVGVGDGQGRDGPATLDAGFFDLADGRDARTGLYALERADIFNLLCIPEAADAETGETLARAAAYCLERRAVLLVDPPAGWSGPLQAAAGVEALSEAIGAARCNAAVFFPRLLKPDPKVAGATAARPPCGAVAGVIARTDAERGVWAAPAGLHAAIHGTLGLSQPPTDPERGKLNPLGVNCLLSRPPAGPVIWSARTLAGADALASEWKYLPVRRLALFLEESLRRGTRWAVFEPNDDRLWAQIRLDIGAFMQGLFRRGAFQGRTPREAFFVRCDRATNSQDDIDRGIVNIHVGFAPLRPAEFMLIHIRQVAVRTT
jgi:phage tail sheath protein FI